MVRPSLVDMDGDMGKRTTGRDRVAKEEEMVSKFRVYLNVTVSGPEMTAERAICLAQDQDRCNGHEERVLSSVRVDRAANNGDDPSIQTAMVDAF